MSACGYPILLGSHALCKGAIIILGIWTVSECYGNQGTDVCETTIQLKPTLWHCRRWTWILAQRDKHLIKELFQKVYPVGSTAIPSLWWQNIPPSILWIVGYYVGPKWFIFIHVFRWFIVCHVFCIHIPLRGRHPTPGWLEDFRDGILGDGKYNKTSNKLMQIVSKTGHP